MLLLRRDEVDHAHFRAPVVLPVLALASCVVLLTQQDAEVWGFGALLLGVGVVLHLVSAGARRVGSRA